MKKFSDELFVNRISDFLGVIKTIWGWASTTFQVGIFLGAIWFTIFDGLEFAIVAWFMNVVLVSFASISIIFSLCCKTLFGRSPGQPKIVRKAMLTLHEDTSKN